MRLLPPFYIVKVAICMILIKLIYYSWAIYGLVLYFRDVRVDDNTAVPFMGIAMMILCALNIMDIIRLIILITTLTLVHCVCKRRARRYLHNRR